MFLQKCPLKISIGLNIELIPTVFFTTWKGSSYAGQMAARKARRKKKAVPDRFEKAYRQLSRSVFFGQVPLLFLSVLCDFFISFLIKSCNLINPKPP
jgi:hypothetical protein